MRRGLAIWLVFVMCLSGAWAAEGRDLSAQEVMAGQLQAVGLFRGGDGGFELGRAMSRVEGVVMLVRALGAEEDALGHARTHPFSDVPAWADGYVSYAWERGLTRGVSETEFGAEGVVSAEMYLTFMLRALGYSEGDDGQFLWDSPWACAGYAGILPPSVERRDFLRADAVTVTCAALFANVKGTESTLGERLGVEGAFSEDPFARDRAIDTAIAEAVRAEEAVWPVDRPNYFDVESHIIAKAWEGDGALTVEAIVCTMYVEVRANGTVGDHGQSTAPWVFQLDPETLDVREVAVLPEFEAPADDPLSPEVRAEWDGTTLGRDLPWVCLNRAAERIKSGELAYRPLTYEEQMAELQGQAGYYEVRRLESPLGTVLYYEIGGTSHGSIGYLALVYRETPPEGVENPLYLPLPMENHWGLTQSAPLTMELDEAGATLTYTYHFDERWVEDEGTEFQWVVHEKGTYRYTTDLRTGVTGLEILG